MAEKLTSLIDNKDVQDDIILIHMDISLHIHWIRESRQLCHLISNKKIYINLNIIHAEQKTCIEFMFSEKLLVWNLQQKYKAHTPMEQHEAQVQGQYVYITQLNQE